MRGDGDRDVVDGRRGVGLRVVGWVDADGVRDRDRWHGLEVFDEEGLRDEVWEIETLAVEELGRKWTDLALKCTWVKEGRGGTDLP